MFEVAVSLIVGFALGYLARGGEGAALVALQQENETLQREVKWMESTIIALAQFQKNEQENNDAEDDRS